MHYLLHLYRIYLKVKIDSRNFFDKFEISCRLESNFDNLFTYYEKLNKY